MSTISLGGYAVLGADGSIDHDATVAKFAGDLIRFEADREVEQSVIADAVNALFDTHLGKRLNTPYVVGEVLKSLNVQPENFSTLTDKVTDFLRTCPAFSVAKGKGGGCGRVADLPVKPAKE